MSGHPGKTRFAVDFAILPPEHVIDTAISLNKQVCNNSYIALDEDQCIPHVSLLMGCLRLDQIRQAELILKAIGSHHNVMTLSVPHIRTVSTPAGDIMTLNIEPHKELQTLHESLVDAFTSLLATDARQSDVFGDAPVDNSTLDWINNYIPDSCVGNFWPHITVGYLKKDTALDEIEPFTFAASRIAICHLGNYCTCKRVLTEIRLAE